MDLRDMGFDSSVVATLHDMFEFTEDTDKPHPLLRAYVRDTKARKATAADIIEYLNAYHFVIDMSGIKSDQIKVQVVDGNVLVVGGKRRREKDKEGVKYLRMERRFGKFLKKFVLPENANTDAISATYHDEVLTVIVENHPPPEPKTIEVKSG